MQRPKFRFKWRYLVACLGLATIIGAAYWHSQYPLALVDFVVSRRFQPSAAVQQLSGKIKLSATARNLLLASQPEINLATEFNQHCPNGDATTAILGCYDERRIYVFAIDHPDLVGVMETTLAHELLHAAYERLTVAQRQALDPLLLADYQRLQTPDLQRRMKFYERSETDYLSNELHSILGTEFDDLSPELEDYYKRYFTDRSAVVAFHRQYSSRFAALEAEAEQLLSQIQDLERRIKADQISYEQSVLQLDRRIDDFNQRAGAGDFSSQVAFWDERQWLLNQADNLELFREQINQLVDQYNQKAGAYNSNLARTQTLNDSLNSLTPKSQRLN